MSNHWPTIVAISLLSDHVVCRRTTKSYRREGCVGCPELLFETSQVTICSTDRLADPGNILNSQGWSSLLQVDASVVALIVPVLDDLGYGLFPIMGEQC